MFKNTTSERLHCFHGHAELASEMSERFPQFRGLSGTDTLYAIEGPKHVTEWQPIGSGGWVIHHHFASDFPRYRWVQELLACEGSAIRMDESEWYHAVNGRKVRQKPKSGGRMMGASDAPVIEPRRSLAALTTFGVDAYSDAFVEVDSDTQVRWALAEAARHDWPLLILGGGSNVLMHMDWEGLVMKMNVRGMEVIAQDGQTVDVAVGAGEVWHEWVMYALEMGWHGLENMALIPGSVGASPMQNIGAYGVEVKDRFLWLEAIHRETGALERFDHSRCDFGYRESIFKQEERDQWVIVRVAFRLDQNAPIHIDYGAIRAELELLQKSENPSHRDVAEAVMRIRQSKLPDPAVLGNAGSFFKNPTLSPEAFAAVEERHPEIVHYRLEDGNVKLAAGWLIDQAGWKGHRRNRCGVHDRQALVLVNYGGATGAEIWSLASDIMADVKRKFGVQLEPEVNQIGL